MTRIIHLQQPFLKPTQHNTRAAWYFMCAALWPNEVFNRRERDRSFQLLGDILLKNDPVTIYERVLLERQRLQSAYSSYLPQPSMWLQESGLDSFAATFILHRNYKASIPILNSHTEPVTILARGYNLYSIAQTPKRFNETVKQLRSAKAYSLLPLFFDAIAHLKH